MIHRHEHRGVVWIDLASPTRDEVKKVTEEFSIHPLVAHELQGPSERSKVDLYENALYLILQFPACGHRDGKCAQAEIDFVIGDNVLVTTHYQNIPALTDFRRMFEINSILEKTRLQHAGHLFYYLMRHLYGSLAGDLERISADLSRVEENIFRGKERLMVESLSRISRELIDFGKAVRGHETVLESLERGGETFFEKGFRFYLTAIAGEYKKVRLQKESIQDILHELRATNDSLLSTKMNEVMKNLTLMAFVTLPLSLIAAIFNMRTDYLPVVGHPYDFWIIVGVMAASMVYILAYFKHRKWL